jgi:hypothetical protein
LNQGDHALAAIVLAQLQFPVQATGTEDNPYMPLKHRFGVPDTDWAADKSQHTSAFWTGEPHIRIEMIPLHVTAVTGWRLRPDRTSIRSNEGSRKGSLPHVFCR